MKAHTTNMKNLHALLLLLSVALELVELSLDSAAVAMVARYLRENGVNVVDESKERVVTGVDRDLNRLQGRGRESAERDEKEVESRKFFHLVFFGAAVVVFSYVGALSANGGEALHS